MVSSRPPDSTSHTLTTLPPVTDKHVTITTVYNKVDMPKLGLNLVLNLGLNLNLNLSLCLVLFLCLGLDPILVSRLGSMSGFEFQPGNS